MNKQHEELEMKGVKAYIAKKLPKAKAGKAWKKWMGQEKEEQAMEKKNG